jgi:hypothetical protein
LVFLELPPSQQSQTGTFPKVLPASSIIYFFPMNQWQWSLLPIQFAAYHYFKIHCKSPLETMAMNFTKETTKRTVYG